MTVSKMLYDIARNYVGRGWSVFPCRIRQIDGVWLKDTDNFTWGEYQKRLPTDAELEGWFLQARDEVGICIVTGKISNLAVIDIDNEELYEEYRKKYPSAYVVKTSRGYHMYYYWREGITNKNRVNGQDVDIRGEGGMVYAPPSGVYRLIKSGPLTDFPHIPTSVDISEYDRHDSTDEGIWQAISAYGLDDDYDYHQRDNRCLAAARALLRKGLDERQVFNELRNAIRRGPDTTFTMQEVKKCVESASNWYRKQLQNKKLKLPYAGQMGMADGWRSEPEPDISFLDDQRFIQKNAVTMLMGKEFSGKSFIAVDRAVNMAENGYYVLYLSFEGFASVRKRFKDRLRDTEGRLGAIIADNTEKRLKVIGDDGSPLYREFYNHFTGRGSDQEIDRDVLDYLLSMDGITPYDVVMVDTAIAAWTHIDENNSNDVRRALQPFDLWVTRHGTTFVYLHHHGKDPTKGARGSSDWNAFPSNSLSITKQDDQYFIKFKKGRDLYDDQLKVKWETYQVKGYNCWRQEFREAKEAIIESQDEMGFYSLLVQHGGPWSNKGDICKTMGIKAEKGRKLVDKWVETGQLIKRYRTYYLPESDEDDIQTD